MNYEKELEAKFGNHSEWVFLWWAKLCNEIQQKIAKMKVCLLFRQTKGERPPAIGATPNHNEEKAEKVSLNISISNWACRFNKTFLYLRFIFLLFCECWICFFAWMLIQWFCAQQSDHSSLCDLQSDQSSILWCLDQYCLCNKIV